MIDTAKIADAEQQAEMATLQRELAIAENQLSSLTEKCSRLEEDNDDLSDKLLRRAKREGDSSVLMERLNDMRAQLREVERDRDRALAEVVQTRSDLQQYQSQIQTIEAAANAEEVEALRNELEMVRQQSRHDLKVLQEQLNTKENINQHSIDSDNIIEFEVLRQEHDVIARTLSDRESELQSSQQTCQLLEDELEDAHKQIDEMRRQLEKFDEKLHPPSEAGAQSTESVEEILAENLNVEDKRVEPSVPIVGIKPSASLFSKAGMRSMLTGILLTVTAMEVVSISNGHGELFSAIMSAEKMKIADSTSAPVKEIQKPAEKNTSQEKKTGFISR